MEDVTLGDTTGETETDGVPLMDAVGVVDAVVDASPSTGAD